MIEPIDRMHQVQNGKGRSYLCGFKMCTDRNDIRCYQLLILLHFAYRNYSFEQLYIRAPLIFPSVCYEIALLSVII